MGEFREIRKKNIWHGKWKAYNTARRRTDFKSYTNVYKDIASGLNPLRSGLKRLLRYCYVHRERIARVYVTYPDRLARFSPQLLVWILQTLWGIDVVFTRPDGRQPLTEEQELVEDVLAILYSFTARLHRRRRGKMCDT